jgi:carbon monoxide dehydrogenase subunit G
VRTSESVLVPAAPEVVFPFVVDLGVYPRWLPLVHAAEPVAEDAWVVELRARVGPFARSKRLRMQRTALVPDVSAVFERTEVDGRQHAGWTLRAELTDSAEGTLLTMHLAYDGRLWTAGVLERVLDEEVRRGRAGLLALVQGS